MFPCRHHSPHPSLQLWGSLRLLLVSSLLISWNLWALHRFQVCNFLPCQLIPTWMMAVVVVGLRGEDGWETVLLHKPAFFFNTRKKCELSEDVIKLQLIKSTIKTHESRPHFYHHKITNLRVTLGCFTWASKKVLHKGRMYNLQMYS